MKPEKIILIRHGESEANVNKRLYEFKPDYLMELTEIGQRQCENRGRSLKPILDGKRITIWSSPYARSRQTSEIIMSQIDHAGLRYREDPRLREQDWGNFYSLDEARIKKEERERHSYFFYRMNCGESGADVYDRISTFLESLYRDFREDDWTEVLIISTHGLTALIFLMRFFHWKYEEYETAIWFDNCDYVILELIKETERYVISMDHRTLSA